MASPVRDKDDSTASIRQRTRSSRACFRCFAKKIRCDGQDTCNHCQQTNSECIYRPQKKRGPPKGCPPRGGVKQQQQRALSSPSSSSYTFKESNLDASSSKSRDLKPSPPLPRQVTQTERGDVLVGSLSTSLSRSLVDSLLDIYVAFIHPHWPIIYLPALRDLHDLETQEPILFDAILSVAATTYDQAVDKGFRSSHQVPLFDSLNTSNELMESAKKRIWQSKLEPRISTIHALMLLSVIDLGAGRSSEAYQLGGIACRMAFDMRLHEGDIEKGIYNKEGLRVVWGCYILDKILAAVLQRPVTMRRENLDVPFPDTMERDEFDLWLTGAARRFVVGGVHPRMEHTKVHCLSSFQAWANVMYILEQILQNIYSRWAMQERKRGESWRYDEILVQLDRDLQRWRESLPPHLQWTNDHTGVGPHVLTLRAWYCACMLLLHRPRVPRMESSRDRDRQMTLLSGADICKRAATEICCIMEAYEETFRARKIPSSWVYLIFQAATIHSSFSTPKANTNDLLSPARVESGERLQQCITWLDAIAQTWTSASHHVEILKGLEHASSVTRPASPAIGMPRLLEYTMSPPASDYGREAAWEAFWNNMPTSSDDISLYQCFFDTIMNRPVV